MMMMMMVVFEAFSEKQSCVPVGLFAIPGKDNCSCIAGSLSYIASSFDEKLVSLALLSAHR
jgi:hypothetical protein